jgi:hypothetical protein
MLMLCDLWMQKLQINVYFKVNRWVQISIICSLPHTPLSLWNLSRSKLSCVLHANCSSHSTQKPAENWPSEACAYWANSCETWVFNLSLDVMTLRDSEFELSSSSFSVVFMREDGLNFYPSMHARSFLLSPVSPILYASALFFLWEFNLNSLKCKIEFYWEFFSLIWI